jgi:hypothetical protein
MPYFVNRVLGKIFGPKRVLETGENYTVKSFLIYLGD